MSADLLITQLLEAVTKPADCWDNHLIGFIHPDGKVTLRSRKITPLHTTLAQELGMNNEWHAIHHHGAVRLVVIPASNWIGLQVHGKHKQAMRNAADFIEREGGGKRIKVDIARGRNAGGNRRDTSHTSEPHESRSDLFRVLRGEEPRTITSIAHIRRSPEFREPPEV